MENGKKTPVRMCVVCRGRFPQKNLYRMQCKNFSLIPFEGKGRSFYICDKCKNSKKVFSVVAYLCKISKEKAKEEIKNFPFFNLH